MFECVNVCALSFLWKDVRSIKTIHYYYYFMARIVQTQRIFLIRTEPLRVRSNDVILRHRTGSLEQFEHFRSRVSKNFKKSSVPHLCLHLTALKCLGLGKKQHNFRNLGLEGLRYCCFSRKRSMVACRH